MLTIANLGIGDVGAGNGVMFELDSVADTASILHAGGWTLLTGINLMLFSLLHNPCSTTIYTIYKETKSVKWSVISTLLPIALGLAVTFFVTQIWRLLFGS
jgi:ferrous iron transport protein B